SLVRVVVAALHQAQSSRDSHVSELGPGLDEYSGALLDLLGRAAEVEVAPEALYDQLALREKLLALVGLLDGGQDVGLALDDEHALRAVRVEEHEGLGDLPFRSLLAPEAHQLHEHLERLGLPAPYR